MKVIHHNDNDGRAAAAIITQLTGNRNPNDYIEIDYTKPIPIDSIQDGENVWIVDISISSEENYQVINKLIERNCSIIWIDHHQSSIDMINKHPDLGSLKGIRNVNRCGAYLTLQYCFGISDANMPLHIKLIDDQDRHGFQDYEYGEKTSYFKLALLSMPNGPLDDIWSLLGYKPVETVNRLLEQGKIIYRYQSKINQMYIKQNAYESTFEGIKCLVVNQKSGSDIFGDKYKDYELLVTWTFNGNQYVYTLFAGGYGNINCAKLAEKYGGGGHPGAAGFRSDKLLLLRTE